MVGARPQFVKAAALSDALTPVGHDHVLVHTGQHWDLGMSDLFFHELGLPAPSVNLGVGSGGGARRTARMRAGLEDVFRQRRPDWVIVVGDTDSTLAGALAAGGIGIPLAHVEAGLRSHNREMPEERNRLLADDAADLLFAPTLRACSNLRDEGIEGDRIALVGDVMYDAFLRFAPLAVHSPVLERLGLERGGYVLATVHRAENTGDPRRLAIVFDALGRVATDLPVVVPLHPRTQAASLEAGLQRVLPSSVRLMGPVGYLDMLALEQAAALVATDSGGVQKEAYFAGVPCVTLRQETEWTELVELGWNRVCPPTSGLAVAREIKAALGTTGRQADLYGGGQASLRIARRLMSSMRA